MSVRTCISDAFGKYLPVQTKREVVEHRPAVVIVPIDETGFVLLVRQYRLPAQEVLLEAPAGGVELGEDPESAAVRELQEEPGFKGSHIIPLGGFWMAPGFCTEFMHAYLATGLRPSPLPPDEDEAVDVVRIPITEILAHIQRGDIQDAKSISALLMTLLLHQKNKDVSSNYGR